VRTGGLRAGWDVHQHGPEGCTKREGRTLVPCGVAETREEREELLAGARVGVLPEDDLHHGLLQSGGAMGQLDGAKRHTGRRKGTHARDLVGHEALGDRVAARVERGCRGQLGGAGARCG